MDWDGYEMSDLLVSEPLNTLPRAEAKEAFQRLMGLKAERIEMLRRLLKANGLGLGPSNAEIQALNDWFDFHVEADPDHPGRLQPAWYSVVRDMSLFLGDLMVEQHPNLRWEFFTWGAKNVSYHRAVIMGFGTEDPKFHTNIDVERNLSTHAHRVVAKRGSVPTYGIVRVRETEVDVDAAAREERSRGIEAHAFQRWLENAGRRA